MKKTPPSKTKKADPQNRMIDPDNITDDDLALLVKAQKQKKARIKASKGAERVRARILYDLYCKGEITLAQLYDQLPENGYGCSMQDIFTATDYKIEPIKSRDGKNSYSGGRKPTWLKNDKELLRAWNEKVAKAKADADDSHDKIRQEIIEKAKDVSEAEAEATSSVEPDYSDDARRQELEEEYS